MTLKSEYAAWGQSRSRVWSATVSWSQWFIRNHFDPKQRSTLIEVLCLFPFNYVSFAAFCHSVPFLSFSCKQSNSSTFSTRCGRSGQRCCRYSQPFVPHFSFSPRRKEAVYLLLLNTRWISPVFEEGRSIFSSCCCVATMSWRICGHQQIVCLIEVSYLFLLLRWLTLSFRLLSFYTWKIARKTLTIAGIPPYSSSRTASPSNIHKSTYLDLLKMLYDRRHHVDAALQGSLLTSEIPSPIKLKYGTDLLPFTDRWVRLFQPLAFNDPNAKGMGASDNLATEGSNVAIPEGQHKRFSTASMKRPLECLRPQVSPRTTSKCDMLLMPRRFECLVAKHNIALISFQCLYTAPDRFSEPKKRYMNSAWGPSSQQLWDPKLVLTALMNIEDDDQEDILIDLEPPRQFRPRPLSNRFGIYCTRNITMHQRNEKAGRSDTKR